MKIDLLDLVSQFVDEPTSTEVMSVIPRVGEKILDVITCANNVDFVLDDFNYVAYLIAHEIKCQRYLNKKGAPPKRTHQITISIITQTNLKRKG